MISTIRAYLSQLMSAFKRIEFTISNSNYRFRFFFAPEGDVDPALRNLVQRLHQR
jgi:hypothetical protein